MKQALKIAQTYLQEQGAMPLMVVAETAKGETITWLGKFRKKHEKEDGKAFCGLLSIAFQVKNIQNYTLLINADMNLDGTVSNVLVATHISRNEKRAKVFNILNQDTLQEVMEIETGDTVGGLLEGSYLRLLPLRRKNFDESVVKNVNAYLTTITYTPPKEAQNVSIMDTEDGFEQLIDNFFV